MAKNEEFQEYDRQLRASFETFRSLMVQVEEFGDGAVEELESNPESLEKFAREKYLMKKDNEELFVIVEEE